MNNDDTPTPRTDEEAWQEDRAYVLPCELVKAEFARTLERELAAAQADVERWQENAMAAKRQRDCIIDEGVEKQGRIDELEKQLAAAQAENSKMVDTIDLMCDEFLRIKAVANIQDEAVTFCDRAVSGIRQRVPVIQQRDDLERKLRAAQAALCEIFDLTDPYADGAPDASEHDKLCNQIAGRTWEWGCPLPPPKGGES